MSGLGKLFLGGITALSLSFLVATGASRYEEGIIRNNQNDADRRENLFTGKTTLVCPSADGSLKPVEITSANATTVPVKNEDLTNSKCAIKGKGLFGNEFTVAPR